eukprot:TRINITY_DN1566_c0_g1_i1.p1 TRINITY_DN1566_c0_g1~~TRINITY_DN1566_c0_g1_i1.p1  ORF type:complete len:135 (-),score=55.52 TRINITY_DN1566_c0_g1_i1:52-456(-)
MAWFFKSDLRYKGDIGWTPYSEEESEKIEEAYKAGKKVAQVNDKYKINLKEMFQYRVDDTNKQREVKREKKKKDVKKQKIESLVGKKVIVVSYIEQDSPEIFGVFLEQSEADEAKAKLKEKGKTAVTLSEHKLT